MNFGKDKYIKKTCMCYATDIVFIRKKSTMIFRIQQNAILKDVISLSSVNTVLSTGYNLSCLEVIFYTFETVLVSLEGIQSPELVQ